MTHTMGYIDKWMGKPTPGPWKALPPGCAVLYNVADERDWMVYGDAPRSQYADCITMGRFTKADAFLVAAAPDLLAACIAVRDGDLESLHSFVRIMDQVKSAIKKAEGEHER